MIPIPTVFYWFIWLQSKKTPNKQINKTSQKETSKQKHSNIINSLGKICTMIDRNHIQPIENLILSRENEKDMWSYFMSMSLGVKN